MSDLDREARQELRTRPHDDPDAGPEAPADLDAEVETYFQNAVTAVRALDVDLDNTSKLRLYALYKQATAGDVTGRRPGFTNPVGRAKYDAWSSVRGMSAAVAKRAYVDLAGRVCQG